ncbi:hypothetical protein [Deinococcus humi]|uniref:DUF4394 domain-containing protein n=1 Tax=Deinococcus humi TaxID=662880 RepID=A0A7W8NE64_9DEIO|nr:hypothetical protein [Deinococcus humi]MBB5363974.1 hypothetical protein [Deinococcus humi]GGO32789.1 hypothetical protein GCM10008949_30930 [Deinococcus humi]
MKKIALLSVTATLILSACGGGTPPPIADDNHPDARAYAVTGNALYSIVLIGNGQDEKKFDLNLSGSLTDVALAGTELYGLTSSSLVRISLTDGAVSTVGALGANDNINALAADGAGNLYGASTGGQFYTVNSSTGRATLVGPMGLLSSGDLAFNDAGQLYGTVRPNLATSDSLARIDPTTGKATAIGGTGKTDVFALKFRGSVLYGLTGRGQVLTLNTSTGAATVVRETGLSFTGLQ